MARVAPRPAIGERRLPSRAGTIQLKRQQMDFATRFTVSIERSGICRRFARVVAGTLAAVAALATAPAQGGELDKDLLDAIHAPKTPGVRWAHEVNGRRFVQALVLRDSADPDLTDLRAFVVN